MEVEECKSDSNEILTFSYFTAHEEEVHYAVFKPVQKSIRTRSNSPTIKCTVDNQPAFAFYSFVIIISKTRQLEPKPRSPINGNCHSLTWNILKMNSLHLSSFWRQLLLSLTSKSSVGSFKLEMLQYRVLFKIMSLLWLFIPWNDVTRNHIGTKNAFIKRAYGGTMGLWRPNEELFWRLDIKSIVK